jgi:deoxyribose-phosphate aldolase
MQIELDLCQNYQYNELIDKLFIGVNNNADVFIIPNHYVSKVKEFLPNDKIISVPISSDLDTKVQNHAIISAAKKGAHAVDLYVNPIHIANKDEDKLEKSLLSNLKVSDDYNVILRAIIEYRLYDYNTIKMVLGILKVCGIEYTIPSSGTMLDDPYDNITICAGMQIDFGLKAIYNAGLWLDDHYHNIIKNKIFGIRMKSVSSFSILKRCIIH